MPSPVVVTGGARIQRRKKHGHSKIASVQKELRAHKGTQMRIILCFVHM